MLTIPLRSRIEVAVFLLILNPNEKRYNWELVYCELYAGGKYKTNLGMNYEYSLGLNGLGACATQYASRWFDVTVCRDGYLYELHFERRCQHRRSKENTNKSDDNRYDTALASR